MTRAQTPAARRTATKDSSSLTFLRVLERVSSSGITQAELGKAVGAAERTVQTWAAGTNQPRGVKAQRLLDIQTIVSLLSDTYTNEGIRIWLHSRNRNLQLRRPIDLLTEGLIDEVLNEAESIAGGM